MTRAVLPALTDTTGIITRPLNLAELQAQIEDKEGRAQDIEAGTKAVTATRTKGIPFPLFRKDGAWLTVVDAAAGSSLLGLAATTAGVNLVGNAASGNTKSDYAQVAFAIPEDYKAGGTLTVRLRAKWTTTLLTVSSKVDVDAAKIAADGSLGSDLCTTVAQQVTIAFADYDFVITPTGRVAGEILTLRVALLGDDTGGTVNTLGAISACQLIYQAVA